MQRADVLNGYDILGLPRDAEGPDIQHAYRRAAKASHPDSGGSTEAFNRVCAAYKQLDDPDERARLDRRLRLDEMATPTAPQVQPASVRPPIRDAQRQAAAPSAGYKYVYSKPTAQTASTQTEADKPAPIPVAYPVVGIVVTAALVLIGGASRSSGLTHRFFEAEAPGDWALIDPNAFAGINWEMWPIILAAVITIGWLGGTLWAIRKRHRVMHFERAMLLGTLLVMACAGEAMITGPWILLLVAVATIEAGLWYSAIKS